MKSLALPLLLMGSLLSCPAHAAAQSPSLPAPCIGRVCVGADLQSLLALPWLEVKLPAPSATPMRGQRRIARALRGDARAVETALAYWPWRWFNAPALQALASLDAVCEDMGYSWRPRSMLKGPAGSKLVVAFEPIASAAAHQHFEVTTITLQFPKGADDAQVGRLRHELSEQFRRYPNYPAKDSPAVRWLPDKQGQPSIRLYAPLHGPTPQSSRLHLQPGCRPAPVARETTQPAAEVPDNALGRMR